MNAGVISVARFVVFWGNGRTEEGFKGLAPSTRDLREHSIAGQTGGSVQEPLRPDFALSEQRR